MIRESRAIGLREVGVGDRPRAISQAAMKRYHLTTFGCQMNEHDSERMKGMLESLGYERGGRARRGRPDPVQHLLDPRVGGQPLIGHLGEAKRLKSEDPERIVGVGRLLVAVDEGARSSSGSRSWTSRSGRARSTSWPSSSQSDEPRPRRATSSSRASRPPADEARARVPGAGCRSRVGCNCVCSYCIVPSTRGREVSRARGELVREVERAGRRRRPGGDAARART